MPGEDNEKANPGRRKLGQIDISSLHSTFNLQKGYSGLDIRKLEMLLFSESDRVTQRGTNVQSAVEGHHIYKDVLLQSREQFEIPRPSESNSRKRNFSPNPHLPSQGFQVWRCNVLYQKHLFFFFFQKVQKSKEASGFRRILSIHISK